MKKLLVVLLALLTVLSLAGCKKTDYNKKSEGVMTYAEYDAAELGDEVVVEFYVQGHQSWWDNKVTVYGEDLDGGYFAYEMACSEDDAKKLTEGTKIRVKGYKSDYAGEVELGSGCTFEFVDDLNYVAKAADVSSLASSEDLIKKQNMKVAFTGKVTDGGVTYKSSRGDDLYFDLDVDGTVVSFCVESYLTDADSETYKAVEALKAGDTVEVTCFLYWWNGANPHVISVKTK